MTWWVFLTVPTQGVHADAGRTLPPWASVVQVQAECVRGAREKG